MFASPTLLKAALACRAQHDTNYSSHALRTRSCLRHWMPTTMQRIRSLPSRRSCLLSTSPNLIDTCPCDYRPPRSIYALTRKEITRGIANRFVHSRTYIVLYLVMAALSVTTVALSLSDGCPGLAFYVLEIIINTSMILEVGIRFVAFGRVSFTSPCGQYSTLRKP